MEKQTNKKLNRIAGVAIGLAGLASVVGGAVKSFAITGTERPAITQAFSNVREDIGGYRTVSGKYSLIDGNSVSEQVDRYNQLVFDPEAVKQLEAYDATRSKDSLELFGYILGSFAGVCCGAWRYFKGTGD